MRQRYYPTWSPPKCLYPRGYWIRKLQNRRNTPVSLGTLAYNFYLEGVSKAEIALNKVGVGATVPAMRNKVVTGLAEDRPIGSKAIFESAANVPERATPHVSCVVEPRIEIRKARVDRRTVTSENRTHPTHEVGRQVNTWPEVIQRQPQHEV